MKNLIEIWWNCCSSIMSWSTSIKLVLVWVLVLTDAISNWTLILCAGILLWHLSSWLLQMSTVSHTVEFSVWSRWISFRQWTEIIWMSLDECCSATVLNGRVLHGRSLHSSLAHCNFWAQNFTGSLVTITALSEIYYKDWRWNNCENQLAFGKVTGKSKVAPFSGHGYIVAY